MIPLEVELSQNHSVNVSCEEYDGDICQYDIDTKTNVDETVRVYEVVLSQLEEKEVLAVEF